MLLRLFFAIAILLFFPFISFGQQPVVTGGRVVDQEAGNPLEGVSIIDASENMGTVSNREGLFSLALPPGKDKDSLRFSMLGYKSRVIAAAELSGSNKVTIEMALEPAALAEVIIREENPIEIIREAIRKIPDNYIADGHTRRGFYRVATKRGTEYMQLSEAVFDVFHYGYGENKKGQLRLEKVRALKDEQASHGIELGLKPNLLLGFDIVDNIKDNPVFGKSGLRDHQFLLQGIVNYEGREAYEITFDQKEGKKNALYKGTIYILKQEKTIVAVHYELSPRGIAYYRYGDLPTRALLRLMDMSIQVKKEELNVKYRQCGAKWVLSDVKNETVLQLKSGRKQYDFIADVLVDYVNTGIDTSRKMPFSDDAVLGNNRFIEHEDAVMDTAFWKDYNIVLPDFPVSAVVAKIQAANETYNLKKRVQQYIAKLPKENRIRIDSVLNYYYRKDQFNGTALILHKGAIILDKSYGKAHSDSKEPATKNTAYRIGSLSKSFTATIILQLAQEGKLDIKAPIGNYLPGYRHKEITIEQLLTHTSGLPNCTSNPTYLATLVKRPMPRKDIIKQFCSDSLEFLPGSHFAYSNTGYMVLAYLAEYIEQKDFGLILKERIFGPLGMKDTYLGWDANAANAATGFLYGREEPYYAVTNLAGAGGITATANDLLLWYKGIRSGRLLPDTVIETMYQPRAAYKDWSADYGYGWMLDKQQFAVSGKSRIVYHPGTDFGFYSIFAKKEDTESLVILLNNTGDFPRFDITDLILSNLAYD